MFNWVSGWFRREGDANTLRTQPPHIEVVAGHNGPVWSASPEALAHAEMYRLSPWVYVAVNRIAEAGALVPLRVYHRRGEELTGVVRHPLEELLDAPNPHLSRFELFEQTIGMLELTGNAYWFLTGDTRGRPVQIWPLRPDRVSIVPDPANYVRGYIYEVDGQRIPLDAVEVVHFKRWHPANDYYGLSALEAARLAVSSDRAMSEWNRNTFGQGNGVPAGIVNIRDFVSDSDFERIKREWRASYGGPQRKTAFLRGGAVEWQNIGLSHTDLDFLQGRQAHRDEILSIFGVPIGLVSENATEANAKVAERSFIERTLWPKLARLSGKITQAMLPFYGTPGDFVAAFDDIRPTDAQARLDEIGAAGPVLSINEIRGRYFHLPPVDWGQSPHTQSGHEGEAGAKNYTPTDDTPQNALAAQKNSSAAATTAANTPVDLSPESMHTEIDQWERFALKRLGRNGGRSFEVRSLPDEVALTVSAELLAAGDDGEAVKAVFQSARQMV